MKSHPKTRFLGSFNCVWRPTLSFLISSSVCGITSADPAACTRKQASLSSPANAPSPPHTCHHHHQHHLPQSSAIASTIQDLWLQSFVHAKMYVCNCTQRCEATNVPHGTTTLFCSLLKTETILPRQNTILQRQEGFSAFLRAANLDANMLWSQSFKAFCSLLSL